MTSKTPEWATPPKIDAEYVLPLRVPLNYISPCKGHKNTRKNSALLRLTKKCKQDSLFPDKKTKGSNR